MNFLTALVQIKDGGRMRRKNSSPDIFYEFRKIDNYDNPLFCCVRIMREGLYNNSVSPIYITMEMLIQDDWIIV